VVVSPARRPHPQDWRPNPGPQTRYLSLGCVEALYGGAAGGGKSESLLVDAARYVGRGYGKKYSALLLRRKFTELERNLVERSELLYPRLGGKYNGQKHVWRFPGGETIRFGHCEHGGDERQYKSDEFQFIGFDELTEFLEAQYVYLFSRLRSSGGVRVRIRAGTNPGGPGHEWVFKRWGYWLDPDAPIRAEPGQVLYFVRNEDGTEAVVPKGTQDAIGRCFVPSLATDNPHVDASYQRVLDELDPVTRAQLKYGNWLIKPARGLLFKRHWFELVDAGPERAQRCRYWDLAATEDGGAFTAGIRMALAEDGIYVEDVARGQWSPGTVESMVLQTAELDGTECMVGLPQDPGQAGVAQVAAYQKLLQGFNVRFLRETGDKTERAKPFSAQAEPRGGSRFGRVKLVRGPWNLAYLQELEAFPDERLKDQVDGSSGALTMLTGKAPAPYTGARHIRSSRA
jgi:predicted phage terminase large subunit-like protein